MPLVARGEARAFEVIYERHGTAVFSLAYRICGIREAAEEVAQDSFLAAWRGAASYDRTRGSVRTWLLGVAHNRAVDTIRKATTHDRWRSADEQAVEQIESPERTEVEITRREDARSMRAVLGALPNEQRRVIELAYFGGFTQEQIAELLDAPVGTVKSRMRLGLEKMRGAIEPTRVIS